MPRDNGDKFVEKYVSSGKSHGTGLENYSAMSAATTQGGSIHLETSEEKGTTITVRLPKTGKKKSVVVNPVIQN